MSRLTGLDLARTDIVNAPPVSHANAPAPELLMQQYGLKELVPLNNNENPLGSSPRAVQAVREAAGQLNRYPDGANTAIRTKLAQLNGIEPEQIVCANGSEDLIAALMKVFINPGEQVLLGHPAYPIFRLQAAGAGAEVAEVPLNERFAFDLPAMLEAISPRTKIVVVINPHNPSGAAVSRAELAAFMERLPDHCLLVMDEAYIDFAHREVFPDILPYIRQGRSVVALRTFSKFMGLAGLRLGYAISTPEIVSLMNKTVETYAVNVLTQAACLAALEDREFAQASRAACDEAKAYLGAELRRLGMSFPESQANFLFVDTGRDAVELTEQLLRRGFLVCPCADWGYPQHIRLSLGLPEQNRRFIAALRDIVGAG